MSRLRFLLRPCRLFFFLVIGLAIQTPVGTAVLPRVKPGTVGLSAERLDRLSRVTQEYVDGKKTAGMVVLIARNSGIAYLQSFGQLDLGRGSPMPINAIFRIASQTKAVTSVAVMMLQEEGKLLLDDPVAKYIPEFAAARVAMEAPGRDVRGYSTVPLQRPITLRDLLTHTAGISYGEGPAKEEYVAAGIHGWFLADKPEPIGEIVKKLAALPFVTPSRVRNLSMAIIRIYLGMWWSASRG